MKLQKNDFIGKDVLLQQKEHGANRKLISFKMTGNSPPPRQNYEIYTNEENLLHSDVWAWGPDGLKNEKDEPMIGTVTSGTHSPSLGCGIGMALIRKTHAGDGKIIEIQIRGKNHQAIICKKPLYQKNE